MEKLLIPLPFFRKKKNSNKVKLIFGTLFRKKINWVNFFEIFYFSIHKYAWKDYFSYLNIDFLITLFKHEIKNAKNFKG